jgi:hypothetical protein
MFMMRPATGSDQDQIATMIRLRAAWMKSRGIYGADGWGSKAQSLAAQAADTEFPVWVCAGSDGAVAGCTSLYTELPEWGWTPQEQGQPSVFLATTVTHPGYAGQRLGALIAWWTLDYGSRNGYQYVRRGCGAKELMEYYRDIQGWELTRETSRHGITAWLLSRATAPQPAISGQITG